MINHIWLGLIVVAFLYAGWRDVVSGDPPKEDVPPVVLEDFEKTTAHSDSDVQIADGKLVWNYEASADPALLSHTFVIEEEAKNASELIVEYEAAGHEDPADIRQLLYLLITDKDGERFRADPVAMTAEDKASFDLTQLEPELANPGATPDVPYNVSFEVRAIAGQAASGSLRLDTLTLGFPPILHVGESVEAESWMGVLTKSATRWAEISIELAIQLIGIMMLWLGLMRIAEKAGMVQMLAKIMKPVMVFLFPELPPDGEAMGAVLMNVAANMLGLGNAATPLGIKAMKEMQKVNKYRDYASNAQCMLLSINTSSVTLIPATVIGYRAASGSTNLMAFWPVMLGSTVCATLCAVIACKVLEKLPVFAIPADAEPNDVKEVEE